MLLTAKQKKAIKDLDSWFLGEIDKIKKKQAKIIKKYQEKKSAFQAQKMRDKIKKM